MRIGALVLCLVAISAVPVTAGGGGPINPDVFVDPRMPLPRIEIGPRYTNETAAAKIAEKERALAARLVTLGRSTTEVIPDDPARPTGWRKEYQFGRIYLRNGFPDAYFVTGPILERWLALGGEAQNMYYPIADQQTFPNGGGVYSLFQFGMIRYASRLRTDSSRDITGTRAVYGAIYEKYFDELGHVNHEIGAPLTEELPLPGGGRYSEFDHGGIVWRDGKGAFWLSDALFRRYKQLRFGGTGLGFPTGDTVVKGRTKTCAFSGGTLKSLYTEAPFKVYTQNVALMDINLAGVRLLRDEVPIVEEIGEAFGSADSRYHGTNKPAAMEALVRFIEREQPDVVALQEVFLDEDRDRLLDLLRGAYPVANTAWGPDESDVVENSGGLMLFSKTPLEGRFDSIYRANTEGADAWANKGFLFATVRPASTLGIRAPIWFNLCVTHNTAAGGYPQRWVQHGQINTMVRGLGNPAMPTLVMGDFNIDSRNPEIHRQLMALHPGAVDLWATHGRADLPTPWGGNPLGTTSDPAARRFEAGAEFLCARAFPRDPVMYGRCEELWTRIAGRGEPKDPSAPRFTNGKAERLDHMLAYDGAVAFPRYLDLEVVVRSDTTCPILSGIEPAFDPACQDMSDHYGLLLRVAGVDHVQLTLTAPPIVTQVKAELTGFTCFSTTGPPLTRLTEDDEVRCQIGLTWPGGPWAMQHASGKTKSFPDVDNGEFQPLDPYRDFDRDARPAKPLVTSWDGTVGEESPAWIRIAGLIWEEDYVDIPLLGRWYTDISSIDPSGIQVHGMNVTRQELEEIAVVGPRVFILPVAGLQGAEYTLHVKVSVVGVPQAQLRPIAPVPLTGLR